MTAITRLKKLGLLGALTVIVGCQATTGQFRKFNLTCNDMDQYQSEMNWEIWGEANSIKKCTGGTAFIQKYDLKNGFLTYQALSNIDSYFPSTTERRFREALQRINSLKSTWPTIPIHEIRTNSRHVSYSVFKLTNSGPDCVYFNMGHGNFMNLDGNADGWNEITHGTVCDANAKNADALRADFEKRVQAFSVRSSKGTANSEGFKPWSGGRSSSAPPLAKVDPRNLVPGDEITTLINGNTAYGALPDNGGDWVSHLAPDGRFYLKWTDGAKKGERLEGTWKVSGDIFCLQPVINDAPRQPECSRVYSSADSYRMIASHGKTKGAIRYWVRNIEAGDPERLNPNF